jgi:hypothetical protein
VRENPVVKCSTGLFLLRVSSAEKVEKGRIEKHPDSPKKAEQKKDHKHRKRSNKKKIVNGKKSYAKKGLSGNSKVHKKYT